MNETNILIMNALEARRRAYAPYSNFYVGAALLTEDGTIFKGCNVENASFGATNCAERTAIFNAVSEGHQKFKAIAIVGGEGIDEEVTGFAYPCGICRQVMREFCKPDEFRIIIAKALNEYEEYTLNELLPKGFGPQDLK